MPENEISNWLEKLYWKNLNDTITITKKTKNYRRSIFPQNSPIFTAASFIRLLVLTLTLKLAGSQARGLVCSQCLNISFFCSQTLALFFTLFFQSCIISFLTNQGKCWEFRRKANHCFLINSAVGGTKWYKVSLVHDYNPTFNGSCTLYLKLWKKYFI